jgi:hypothetical protein
MKFLRRLLVVMLLVVVAALGTAWFMLDPLVEAAVSHGGTEAAGVPVVLEEADVSLVGGSVHLGRLSIANPPGWSERPFFALRQGALQLGQAPLWSDALEIETLDLSGIELSLEQRGKESNWKAILANLERFAARSAGPDAAQPAASARKLHAKLVALRDVRVVVEVDGVPWVSGKRELVLPLVEVRDLRSDGSTAEIVGALLSALLRATLDAALAQGADWLPRDFSRELGVDLRALREALDAPDLLEGGKQLLRGVEGLLDGAKRR